ncbi:MAG: nucleoside hydrolase-like domain-containing protein [Planctomycetota bacterium]
MKWTGRVLLILVAASGINQKAFPVDTIRRPCVIVTTDGEYDDQCSMVRLLLYANEFDIQGLIFSSSKHHWKGTRDIPGYKWLGTEWLEQQLNAYADVFPNLRRHDPDFPSPDDLKSRVFIGNILLEGDMNKPTQGSDHIVQILLSSDSSPVWLLAWGGPNTIARALKTIGDNYPERKDDVTERIRMYLISEQDSTYRDYISKQWPQAKALICNSTTYGAIAYRWYNHQTSEQQSYFNKDWITRNILENHGPLCELYKARSGGFRSEGDSPSFLHLIDVGLGDLNNPEYGGWGGRFTKMGQKWRSSQDQGDKSSLSHWIIAFQNDYAARADWCVRSYRQANHPPEIASCEPANIEARAGQTIRLSVSRINDPDGDELKYHWWHYPEATTYKGQIELHHSNQQEFELKMPKGQGFHGIIHMICSITDNGNPPLTRYQRMIIKIRP